MIELTTKQEQWFNKHYSHSILGMVSAEAGKDAVLEDWTFYNAVQQGSITPKDLPAIDAFDSKRYWRIRINTGLALLGLETMESQKAVNALNDYISENKVD